MAVPVATVAKTALRILGLFKKSEGEDSSLGGKLVVIILAIIIAVILLMAIIVFLILSKPLAFILDLFGLNILDYGELNTPQVSPSQYVYPAELATISNPYGAGTQFYTFHTGIDIPVAEGSSLVAIENGEMVDYGYSKDFGRWMIIKHTRPTPFLTWLSPTKYRIDFKSMYFYTFYAHLLEVKCVRGQKVKQGDIIASSGGNINNKYDYWVGNSTGSHLHFEIREHTANIGSAIDPLTYLNRNVVQDEIDELIESVGDDCVRVY